jgi:hypothetical protein
MSLTPLAWRVLATTREAEGCVRESNATLTRVAVLKVTPRFVFKKRSGILHNALPGALIPVYGSSRERARQSTVSTDEVPHAVA